MKKVHCVPGDHEIAISDAYWCQKCRYYLCYRHALTELFVNTVKCPRGHTVARAQ